MSNAWILAPIVVIDVLFVFNLAAILIPLTPAD
jgi:hypothetical protein